LGSIDQSYIIDTFKRSKSEHKLFLNQSTALSLSKSRHAHK